ncbi:hypothetical protein BKA66DRAFT_472566 [Pyrenochaeta sp. MPI-SDFR-AT-0127]|nr:hypothetical protein BKA66DRAFT_472566 [Pyrenochaeta sp. MPI-SDFR-AT-0127]
MKHSQPRSTGSTSNPTSCGATVAQYATLLYLAAHYLLHDDPRHVQYRDAVRHAQGGTPNAGHDQSAPIGDARPSPITPNPSTLQRSSVGVDGASFHFPSGRSPLLSAPWRSNYDCHIRTRERRSKPDGTNRPEPSKTQMNEAWMRMRPGFGTRTEPIIKDTANKGRHVSSKSGKGVRWGTVQVNACERMREPSGFRHECVEQNDMLNNNDQGTVKADTSNEQEIWGPVLPAEHADKEIWGSVKIRRT